MVEVDLARLRALEGIKWTKHGPDVLPAFVADMDFTPAPPIGQAIVDIVERGDFGYNFAASDQLVTAWADFQERRHRWRPPEHESAKFCGTLHALETFLLMGTEPGDGVVLFTPIYYPFRSAIVDSGRRVVDVALDGPDWCLDADRFEAALDPNTKMVLFSQPHNPLGRVFDAEELAAFADVVERHDLLVISDEIWGDFIYDECPHLPLATTVPQIGDRLVTLGSASKSFGLPGLRCSVAHVGHRPFLDLITTAPVHLYGGPSSTSAAATVAAWTQCDDWLDDVKVVLAANRGHVARRVACDLPGVTMHLPEATYLGWLDFADTAIAFEPAEALLEQAQVALEPGHKFDTQAGSFARFNFATSRELIDEFFDRIANVLLS